MLELPLFPLNVVLLPFEYLPLHIFEPRYKDMIKNSIENNMPFGIILSEKNQIYPKGCRAQVSKVYREYNSGEYDVLVKGLERFQLLDTNKVGETVIGKVKYTPIEKENNSELMKTLQNAYLEILIKYGVNTDLENHMDKNISYEFFQSFQMPLTIKKKLISIDTENKRLQFVSRIFEKILESNTNSFHSDIPKA